MHIKAQSIFAYTRRTQGQLSQIPRTQSLTVARVRISQPTDEDRKDPLSADKPINLYWGAGVA